MKQPFSLILIFSLWVVASNSIFAYTIMGLEKARYFTSNVSKSFYIQAGSFRQKTNALHASSALQKKINYSVRIKKNKNYYVVLIGPLPTTLVVRNIAQHIQSNSTSPVEPLGIQTESSTKTKKENLPIVSKVKVLKRKEQRASDKWMVGAGVGAMFPFGTNTTNYASSGIPNFPDDKYVADNTRATGQYSLFVGYQWRRDNQWLPAYSLSLQYAYTDSARINGAIFVNGLPDSKNFTFHYDISQHLPMVKFKAGLYRWWQFIPYATIGTGLAFNHVHNYSDNPILGATFMQRRYTFNSSTNIEFSCMLGAGVDFWLNDKSQLGLGYELSYYGKAKTGSGTGNLSANHLSNNIYSNALVLQGTYFLDRVK